MKYLSKLIEDLSASKSQFHSIERIRQRLLETSFKEVKETKPLNLEKGGKYFLKRNDSSLIAFKIPNGDPKAFKVSATHSDSPTFKIKPDPIINNGDVLQLKVEPYGGAIYPSWIDRPLSIAGRILIEKDGNLESHLFDIDEDLLEIPSLCIHFNRDVNKGHEYNPAIDMVPVLGMKKDLDFNKFLLEKSGLEGEVVSYDLYLYNRDLPRVVGLDKEFLSAPKEDDLASAFIVLYGYIDAPISNMVDVYCCFDNEEVGSLTRQGAHSDFLKNTLIRISKASGIEMAEASAGSFMLSVDNAHARHPNFPSLNSSVNINGGIVIKYNANQSYTSDGLSSSLVKAIAKANDIPVQEFTNRADIRGGSTLGNLSNAEVSLLSCDIGIAQWAMHSSNETLGVYDIDHMANLSKAYFESKFEIDGGNIAFIK